MKYKIVDFIALFFLMLLTGVFWGTWFTLTRSIESFSAGEFIHIGKVIIANVALPMRIIMPLCIVFVAISIWFYRVKKSRGFYFCIAAFVFIIVTLLITLIILVPIDNQVKLWTTGSVPSDWEEIRSRWQFFHTARTITSITCFGCFALSIIERESYLIN